MKTVYLKKGEIGSGQSLSLKGKGYPDDREGQNNYNYNNYLRSSCPILPSLTL